MKDLSLEVYKLFTEKGKEMKRAKTFSPDSWNRYVLSLGCEFTHETEKGAIVVRDEHHFTQLNERKIWDRLIKIDLETALKIVVLGLP